MYKRKLLTKPHNLNCSDHLQLLEQYFSVAQQHPLELFWGTCSSSFYSVMIIDPRAVLANNKYIGVIIIISSMSRLLLPYVAKIILLKRQNTSLIWPFLQVCLLSFNPLPYHMHTKKASYILLSAMEKKKVCVWGEGGVDISDASQTRVSCSRAIQT